jgi:hypothetical protein
VKYEYTKSSENDNGINIKDIGYDRSRRILFVLDYNTGLVPLKIMLSG